jgi:hypothetical protein
LKIKILDQRWKSGRRLPQSKSWRYMRSALRFAKRFGVRQLATALRTNSTSYRDFTILAD